MFDTGRVVYLSIRRHWLSVRVVPQRGEAVQVEGIARVAMRHSDKGNGTTVGIGEEVADFATARNVIVSDAFCHPRVLIGDFDNALLVVREFLRRACGGKRPLLRFRMVVYTPNDLEGGLTDVEKRALEELGLRLRANNVSIQSEPSHD